MIERFKKQRSKLGLGEIFQFSCRSNSNWLKWCGPQAMIAETREEKPENTLDVWTDVENLVKKLEVYGEFYTIQKSICLQ